MKFYLLLAFILMASNALAYRNLSTEQKLSDFNQLLAQITSGYGPLEYKKNTQGIDWRVLKDRYTSLIENSSSNSEFYYLIVKFVAEFNDSHFGAILPTTHKASLGFNTDYINGKVLIDEINRNKLSEEDFDFAKGDEIVEFNGRPVMEEINDLYAYMGQGTRLTALRKAAMALASRPGAKVPVPNGKVKLKIRKGESSIVVEKELEWQHSGTPMDEYIAKSARSLWGRYTTRHLQLDKLIAKEPFLESSYRCSGSTRIKIPSDATVIMREPFVAYYHPTSKGNIGYLRIPHYSPQESNPEVNAYDLRFSQYEYAVSELEKNTVGLVIDQDHNCGGSVSYLFRMLSLFIPDSFVPTQFELLANKESVVSFQNEIKDMEELYRHTLDYTYVQNVLDLITRTWTETDNFLTPKTGIGSAPLIYANAHRYTKPIIVLVDEMSGSGGDAFPAMMQGNNRAKLLGTRTMGAGGHVIELPALANSQISVRMTKSLFYHPNNVAIENNGATPDIQYTPTRNDFLYEYQEYQTFYLNELFKLL